MVGVLMETLIELSAKASLIDLCILKHFTKHLHRTVLYKLVRKCFCEPKKSLAFAILIQSWPLEYFSAAEINIGIKEDDVILIASLIQKNEIGSIRYFDLLSEKFGALDHRATDACLKICLKQDPLLSIEHYGTSVSCSYNEALRLARRFTCTQHNDQVGQESNTLSCDGETQYEHDTLNSNQVQIQMELVVNDSNFNQIIELCKQQRKDLLCVQLLIASLHFEYLGTMKITKVLDSMNKNELVKVDLSYSCLSNSPESRLASVCEKLQLFPNLRKLSFAYNTLDGHHCNSLRDCLMKMAKLQYLDLSWNRLGTIERNFVDLLDNGLQLCYLKTLLLSGCVLKLASMEALANSNRLVYLEKLKIGQNPEALTQQSVLKKLLLSVKKTLKYLDISSCAFRKERIVNLCPLLCELQYLQCLVVWPNPGITAETVKNEILPLLQHLPFLEMVPPIANVKEIINIV